MFTYETIENKTNKILNQSIIEQDLTGISVRGSTSRNFLETLVLANEISEGYFFAKTSAMFYDTAIGSDLDRIAQLNNLQRSPNETDDNLRIRILNNKNSNSSLDNIKYKIMAIENIKNVYMYDNLYGVGSLGIYIEQLTASELKQSLIDKINNILKENCAAGIKYSVLAPNYRLVSLNVSVYPKEESDYSLIKNYVVLGAQNYINKLIMGESLSYNKLLSYIVESTRDYINDLDISNIYIDNIEYLKTNIISQFDDKFVPNEISVTIGS